MSVFSLESRTNQLQVQRAHENFVRVSRIFKAFFLGQLLGAAAYAAFSHQYAGLIAGLILTPAPLFLMWRYPEHKVTRVSIAVTQILFSLFLVHLSGGRIEMYLHLFASLAFLGFYMDAHLIYVASAIAMIDQLLRGMYWPIEWVVLEDIFLLTVLNFRFNESFDRARKEIQLQVALHDVEQQVIDRTIELVQSRQALATAAKMSALGEMAGGIAHEINTPLASIFLHMDQIQVLMEKPDFNCDEMSHLVDGVQKTTDRIAKIVKGLRAFSRDGSNDRHEIIAVEKLIDDTLNLCGERFRSKNVNLTVEPVPWDVRLSGQPTQLSQVLLNLLNNAFDAVESQTERWIRIGFGLQDGMFSVYVTDSGAGITPEVKAKLFQPFFTTKEPGKGMGLGLSIAKGIMESHNGGIQVDTHDGHTRFVMSLPVAKSESLAG